MIQIIPIYVLWLREIKKFVRMKSRIVGTLTMPFFLLVFLGLGFRRADIPGLTGNLDYIQFLVPGMVGMTVLFSSSFTGVQILMDRQFGFLKEIMVAPVSRLSIVLGRIIGGGFTAVIQGCVILLFSLFLGFHIGDLLQLPIVLVFMILISVCFMSIGLICASYMKDVHGFTMIMNLIVYPIFLVSGAIFPISNLPAYIRIFSYASPLTYGVDGLRGMLTGYSDHPVILDLGVIFLISVITVTLATLAFKRSPL